MTLEAEHPKPSERHGRDESDTGEIEISLVGMLNTLLRHRRLIVGVTFLFGVAAVTFVLLRHRDWSARAVFRPEGQSAVGNMSGLAAQFGVNLSGAGDAEPLAFYVELLRSRQVREQVLDTQYTFTTREPARDTVSGTYYEIFEIRRDTPRETRRAAFRHLGRNVSISTDLNAGVVYLEVISPWPELSEQIAARMLALVNEYNLERRQSQAAEERQFVESRMRRARQELSAAEAEMEEFLERNRQYESSPQLSMDARRLQRQVDLRSQVYGSLAESYEKARIDEVRNTPVISIVDAPEGSARPTGLGGMVVVALAGLFGLAFSVLLAFLVDFLARQRHQSGPEYLELRRLWAGIRSNPTLGVGRRGGPGGG